MGEYEKLKLPIYKLCKITGPLNGEIKTGSLAKCKSVLGYVQLGHILGDVQIEYHKRK